jgi:hypothetical protein
MNGTLAGLVSAVGGACRTSAYRAEPQSHRRPDGDQGAGGAPESWPLAQRRLQPVGDRVEKQHDQKGPDDGTADGTADSTVGGTVGGADLRSSLVVDRRPRTARCRPARHRGQATHWSRRRHEISESGSTTYWRQPTSGATREASAQIGHAPPDAAAPPRNDRKPSQLPIAERCSAWGADVGVADD